MSCVCRPSLIQLTIQTAMKTSNALNQIAQPIFTIGFQSLSLNHNTKIITLLAIIKFPLSRLLIFAIYVMPTAKHVQINSTTIVLHVPLIISNGNKVVLVVVITVTKVITLQEV